MKNALAIAAASIALTLSATSNATVTGYAYLNSPASTSAVIGFAHGAPDVVFSVPSSTNAACTGAFSGDTLCFQTDDSDNTTLDQFLSSGGATVISSSPATLSGSLDDTGFEFAGNVSVTTGQMFQAGHDDGLQLMIGSTLVIDAPTPTSFSTTPAAYNGPPGTFAFDLVYGECCGGPADLGISLPLSSVNVVSSVPEPASLAVIGAGIATLCALRRRFGLSEHKPA